MKKIILSLLTLCLSQFTFAQTSLQNIGLHSDDKEEERGWYAEGMLTFWQGSHGKSTLLDITPEVGYMFDKTWGAGVKLGYEYERRSQQYGHTSQSGLKFEPYMRYYYLHHGMFNLYLDGGVGVNTELSKSSLREETEHEWGWEAGVRPGVCLDLSRAISICMEMGFVGYRHHFTMAEEELIGSDGFGLRLSPDEVRVGLEFEF